MMFNLAKHEAERIGRLDAYAHLVVVQQNGNFVAQILGRVLLMRRRAVEIVEQRDYAGRIATDLRPLALQVWYAGFDEVGDVIVQMLILEWEKVKRIDVSLFAGQNL